MSPLSKPRNLATTTARISAMLLASTCILVAAPAFAQAVSISFTGDTTGQPLHQGLFGGPSSYIQLPFSVVGNGLTYIDTTADASFNAYGQLYQGSYDPSNPNAGLHVYSGAPNPVIVAVLDPLLEYYSVASSWNSSISGEIEVKIQSYTGVEGIVLARDLVGFDGTTKISQGRLQIGNGGTSGALGSGTVANYGDLAFKRSDSFEVANVITGTGSVAMEGTGVMSLSGVNTYSGGTNFSAGTILVSSDANLGDVNGGLTFDGGTMQLGASFNPASSRVITLDAGGGTIDTNGFDMTIAQTIGGSGDFTKAGDGTLTLRDRTTYTGHTTIEAGGTLALANQGNINSSSGVTVNGIFDISNGIGQIASLDGNGEVVLGSKTLQVRNSGAFGGSITGAGAFGVLSGTQVLTGANTFGAAQISSGATLQIGNGGTSGSITGNVLNYGAIVFDRSDDWTYSGIITGVGTFAHVGSGKLTLTGTSSSRGDVLIATGSTLQLGDGGATGWIGGTNFVGTITNNGELIYNRSNDVTFKGPVTGSGSIRQVGSGSLFLTGANTYVGNTDVMSGSLVVNGNSTSSVLTSIYSGATLKGTGTVGNTNILVGGIHAPGNSIGTQTISGNYANHGILQIEGTPAETDKLIVTGDVDITNATLELLLSPSTSSSWSLINGPYILIDKQSAGAVTGQFASITNNLIFLNPTVSYTDGDGNDVSLTLARNEIEFASLGRTRNQIATANAIESLPNNNPVWNAISLTTDADIARLAFGQLSGEIHASAKTALVEDSQHIRNAMNDRLRAALNSVAAPSFPVLAYDGDKVEVVAADTDRFGFWTQGFGSWGHIDDNDNAAKLDRSVGGLLFGADTQVGDWRVGALAGYSRSSFDVDDRLSSGDSDNIHLGVYGGTKWGQLGFRTGLAYTWNDITTNRSVAFGSFNEGLQADYKAGTFQIFGELGYRIDTPKVALEPFVNVAHVSHHTNGYSERGGVAALTSTSQNMDTTSTTLGLRASKDFKIGKMKATASGTVGWKHSSGDVDSVARQAFSSGDIFSVGGAPIAKNAAVIEAGVDFNLSPKAKLGLSYQGQIASKAQEHGFKLGLSIKF